MGSYLPGDVVLVSLAIDDRSGAKIRPAVVIAEAGGGGISVCPVSSKPPTDTPSVPLSLDDFASGGLDLFGESYIMISRIRVIRSGEVIGKRGRIIPERLDEIKSHAGSHEAPDGRSREKSGRPGPVR